MRWGDKLQEIGILKNKRYVEAFNNIRREDFLPESVKKYSNSDEPLPLILDQTQTAPHMNALFIEYAKIKSDDTVLEIGTGSGYLTALLAKLSKKVITIEFFSDLSIFAGWNLKKYDLKNIYNFNGDFYRSCWKIKFDKIIITAAIPSIPDFLYKWLNTDGIAIFPLGKEIPQKLIKIEKNKIYYLDEVYFVNIIS